MRMQDLAALCADLGFENVRTYIQSGNVVFRSRRSQDQEHAALEGALAVHMGKKVDVLMRDAGELRRILDGNPFPHAAPSAVAVLFGSHPVSRRLLEGVVAPGGEQVVAGKQEIYIHYPNGMGRSKLKLPKLAGVVTARNLNTVAKLVAMAEEAARLPPAPTSGPAPGPGGRAPTRKARPARRRARA